LLQPSPVPSPSLRERLRTGAGRRTLAIGFALLIEALLLLMLLSLGTGKLPGKRDKNITLVDLQAAEAPQEAAVPDTPEPAKQAEERPAPQAPAPEQPPLPRPAEPLSPPPAEPRPVPPLPSPIPAPVQPPPSAATPREGLQRPPAARPVYGPPDKGRPAAYRDTERVGTAPNGQPLYAASWYREPRDDMLRAYLSTARGPGWGLIACRTAPDYRVEDCVGLDEYPEGSQIARSVLAAAWEFRVRPPRLGGQPQVGAWVRIRIDYGNGRR
jgi:protein TonB